MNTRVRKAIGSIGIVVFLIAYVWAAISIGVRLPDQWAIRLAYYALAGLGWSLPMLPLISWMNRGD